MTQEKYSEPRIEQSDDPRSDAWWINQIRSAISAFSDYEFQKRVWLRGKGPEVDSYVEAWCALYDDFQLEKFIEEAEKRKFLPGETVISLKNLNKTLREFEKNNPSESPDDILNDQGWPIVLLAASRALESV